MGGMVGNSCFNVIDQQKCIVEAQIVQSLKEEPKYDRWHILVFYKDIEMVFINLTSTNLNNN